MLQILIKSNLRLPPFLPNKPLRTLLLFLKKKIQVNLPFSKYGNLASFGISEQENIETKKRSNQNIEVYKKACAEIGLSGIFIREIGVPEDETFLASRFADLLLMRDDLLFAINRQYNTALLLARLLQ